MHPAMLARLAAVICALALCASDVLTQTVRDSAGVRIVSYERNARPSGRWTLDPKPLLEIGGSADEGPTAFAGINGVARLSDGRIAVANSHPNEIRIFNGVGVLQLSLGRTGQGPGEFNRRLFHLRRSGDTLIGIDNTARVQVFAPTGELSRSLSRPRVSETGGAPMRLAFDAQGRALVHVAEIPPKPPAAGEMYYVQIFREDAEDRYVPILRVPAYRSSGAPPPMSSIVFAPVGRIVADAERVCTGYSNTISITCHDYTGRPRLSVRRDISTQDITEDDRAFYRNMLLADVRRAPPATVAMVEDIARRSQFARRAPAFSHLMLGQSGDIWVSEFDRAGTAVGSVATRTTQIPLRWSVFDRYGRWLSDLTLPPRFTPYEMGADYVLGVKLGEDDVERVTLYRIRK